MLTYGIFLFLSIFPIIHPKGLAQMPEENMENTKLLPLGTEQGLEETEYPSFDPVSYTHLDVYKRQAEAATGRAQAACQRVSGALRPPCEGRRRKRGAPHDGDFRFRTIPVRLGLSACLLYTS